VLVLELSHCTDSIHRKAGHKIVKALLHSLKSNMEPLFHRAENCLLQDNHILNIQRWLLFFVGDQPFPFHDFPNALQKSFSSQLVVIILGCNEACMEQR
jgi:hypothetical protein